MAVIYGTIPDAATLAQFTATKVVVKRWVDIYQSDNITRWLSQVPLVDGNVSVDSTRAERRNLDLTLLDDGTLGYGPGNLWYDKIFKIYSGIQMPDVTVPGFMLLPGGVGYDLRLTRSALDSAVSLEFAVKVSLNALATAQYLMGWQDAFLSVDSSNKLYIEAKISGSANKLGATASSVAIPGLTAGTPIWLRATLDDDSKIRYYYSNGTTNDYDLVNWTEIGTEQTGAHTGVFDLTHSSAVVFGSKDGSTAGFAGKLFAGSEGVSGAKTIEFEVDDLATGDTTVGATTGQTLIMNNPGVTFYTVGQSTAVGDIWVVCLGEFLADVIERTRLPHNIHITGRDFTKKCDLSKFGQTTAFDVGTNIADTIKNIATNAGIVKFNFVTDATTLDSIATFEKDDTRWKAMSDLAQSINMELFFSSYGILTLKPYVDPLTAPLYFTFQTGEFVGNLVDYNRSTNDSQMFNHVVVYGNSQTNGLVFGEATNTNASSPTRIQLIGDRMMAPIGNPFVTDNAAARAIALSFLRVAGLEQYEFKLEAINLPWLEGGVAVSVIVPDSAPSDPTRFLLTDFTIPLALAPMSGTARRVTIVGSG